MYLCSRKQSNVTDAVAELTAAYGAGVAFGEPCNVAKPGELERFVEKVVGQFGHVDVVISNVGVNPTSGSALDMSDANYDKIMDSNVKSHWRLVKLIHPFLTKNNAAILLVSSTGAYNPSYPIGIYSMSKTALLGLGRALASEMGKDGIRVNTICPGLVRTKMAEMLWKSEYGEKQAQEVFMRRLGDPEDMVGTMAYLVSDDAKHVSGESVVVSGGGQSRM